MGPHDPCLIIRTLPLLTMGLGFSATRTRSDIRRCCVGCATAVVTGSKSIFGWRPFLSFLFFEKDGMMEIVGYAGIAGVYAVLHEKTKGGARIENKTTLEKYTLTNRLEHTSYFNGYGGPFHMMSNRCLRELLLNTIAVKQLIDI